MSSDGMIEQTLFEKIDLVDIAIKRLQTYCPDEGYYLAFSGGKDSVAIKALADMANVKYDAHYNMTTVDPPEVVRFIKKFHPDVIIDRPPKAFLVELLKRGYPMRQSRWCCEYLKEKGGEGRRKIIGVRWAESAKRAQRKTVEKWGNGINIHPILEWSDDDVWKFIKIYNLPYCKLYDEGWKRIGCLMCPLASKESRIWESEKYPKFKNAYIKAFEKLYNKRKSEGKSAVNRWDSGKEMFDWWMGDGAGVQPDQCSMFE